MKIYHVALILVLSLTTVALAQLNITEGDKKLPLAGKSFKLNGHDAFVLLPENANATTPWVWYAPTLPDLPGEAEVWMFERFLAQGIAIAGIDIGNSYGSPDGRKLFSNFYQHLTKEYKFSKKPCFLALGYGGLMAYNWAAENPNKVSCIAALYPACDLERSPGLAKAADAYKMTLEELIVKLDEHNPIKRIMPLIKAGVPILHLEKDPSEAPPNQKSVTTLMERYKLLGGSTEIELIKSGEGDVGKLWFQSEKLTNFVIASALAKKGNSPQKFKLPGVTINSKERYVDVDATVALDDGPLELIVCTLDTKEHESIFYLNARPMHVHTALLLISAKPGAPAHTKFIGDFPMDIPASGDEVDVSVVITDETGNTVERPIEEFIVSSKDSDEKFPNSTFLFAGSRLVPQQNGKKLYSCDRSGHVISIATFGDELLCLPGLHSHQKGALFWSVASGTIPKVDTEVTLRLRLRPKPRKAQ